MGCYIIVNVIVNQQINISNILKCFFMFVFYIGLEIPRYLIMVLP